MLQRNTLSRMQNRLFAAGFALLACAPVSTQAGGLVLTGELAFGGDDLAVVSGGDDVQAGQFINLGIGYDFDLNAEKTLLLRDGRGVRMTPGGQRLFEHGVGILQQVARARDDIDASRNEPSGRIVVGMPPSVARRLTLPLIEAFGQRLPRARLAVVEGLSAHIAEWVATGRVDVALLYDPEPQVEIETLPLHEEALALVEPVHKQSGEASAPTVTLRELARLPLVMPERAHTFRRRLEAQAAQAGVKLSIAWEVSSVPSIIELVCAHVGDVGLGPARPEGYYVQGTVEKAHLKR